MTIKNANNLYKLFANTINNRFLTRGFIHGVVQPHYILCLINIHTISKISLLEHIQFAPGRSQPHYITAQLGCPNLCGRNFVFISKATGR